MNRMHIWSFLSLALSISSLTAVASAEDIDTTDGTFTVIESTAPLGTPLTYVSGGDDLTGIGGAFPQAFGPAEAMNNFDHKWLQFEPSILMMSSVLLNEVFAIPGVDHGPIPQENLEFRIWGSNAAGAMLEEGVIGAIYRDGFDTANTFDGPSDDYTSLWKFSEGPYDHFLITGGTHFVKTTDPNSTEGEIDGLAGKNVPETATLFLLGSGLAGVALLRRKQAA